MINLTDTEKTALESMSETDKKAFFDKKRTEIETKQEAKEIVIDKLLAGTSLTTDEEIIKAEIIKERAEMKAKKLEMEKFKTILEKKRNAETLTTDEQSILDKFEASKPKFNQKNK